MRDLDKYQADYAGLPFEPQQALYRKRKMVEHLRRHQAKRILEVGCGLDPLCTHYSEFEVLHIVEPSRVFFDAAANKCKELRGVQLHPGTLEQNVAQLANERFDFVLLGSLLHEVENPRAILADVRRLCRENTIVQVIVPNAKSLHRLLAVEMGLIDSAYSLSSMQNLLQQQRNFDLERLTGLMASCDFSVFESGTFFIKPFTHAQMAELMERGFLTTQMLEGLYALGKYLPEFGSEIFVNARANIPR